MSHGIETVLHPEYQRLGHIPFGAVYSGYDEEWGGPATRACLYDLESTQGLYTALARACSNHSWNNKYHHRDEYTLRIRGEGDWREDPEWVPSVKDLTKMDPNRRDSMKQEVFKYLNSLGHDIGNSKEDSLGCAISTFFDLDMSEAFLFVWEWLSLKHGEENDG